jgi:hypothetical protein
MKERKRIPNYLSAFLERLEADLKKAGIQADVDTESVRGTRLHRVMVVSPNFRNMRQGERQDLVWRIADNTLTPEQQLRISMIITVTPTELSE